MLLDVPLAALLGQVRPDVPIYGSGGTNEQRDRARVGLARECIAAAAVNLRHIEYFHDHQRIERMLLDGALDPAGGKLTPICRGRAWAWNSRTRTPWATGRASRGPVTGPWR